MMGLWKTIRRWTRRKRPARSEHQKRRRRSEEGPYTIRRWDSAQNNSLNPNRWLYAHGQSINTDLDQDLSALMARCSHEYANNPLFEGVVNTFKDDVVGPEGPMLQIVSSNERFNEEIERQWRGIFALPNPKRPSTGGVESMKQWVHLLLTAGSYINTYITPTREGLVKFGWKTYHPRRLVTPPSLAGNPNVAFGIKTDDDGNPIEYYLDRPREFGAHSVAGIEYDTVPAHQVQHRYIEIEPEQMTGFPMMASTLDTAADIRELDKSEIKSQQRNASHSLGLQAVHPEMVLDPEPIDTETYPVSNDQVNVAPPGWAWSSLDANRPSSEHIEYRRERITELGRPVGMPLLVILLTVADVNFSSAQFGGMLYSDAIRHIQSFIARLTLDSLVESVILEAILTGRVRRPRRYEKVWTHNVPPNANIEKFVKALRILVEDGVISRGMATAWLGFDPEKVSASRKRDIELADKDGVSPPPVNAGASPVDEETEEENAELATA